MTALDPSTRFSLAQIARAWHEYITTDTYPRLDTFVDCLAAQRGQYQHRRPGSNPGGYPKGRPRKSTREEN